MDIRAIALGVAFGVMWASAFTSARVIVQYASPLHALAIRFLISGLIGVVLARMLGQSWHLTRRQWTATIVFGVCQNALYLGLNFVAMQTVEASLAAIIASTMPLIVAIAGWAVFGEKLPLLGVAGLFAGVVGVAIIMGARVQGGADLYGIALCAIAVLSLAVATMSVRGASSGGNFLMIVGLQMLVGSALLWGAALSFETFQVTWSWQLGVAFAYTVVVPGLMATLVWFVLVNRIGAVRAAVFHFLTPFFGVLTAWVLLSEPLGWSDVIGVAIITFGILAVQLSRQKPASPAKQAA
ncbi:DMT family transporter [Salibaculum griseiflavum]|uniref:EamA family transporter n=1 Tax=Salibaculum griseiflavum TaxID=1914409 RepID=A0A2V1P3Y7_9RHOB|nr:DMT family transporter [Salibaculum griseiflavum]PWG16480.1 EamA family transporter [Salibaculum griseiflavum]